MSSAAASASIGSGCSLVASGWCIPLGSALKPPWVVLDSVRAYREWLQIPFAPREWLSRSAPEARSTWNLLPAPDSVGVYGIRCLYLFFFIRPPSISKHRRRLEHPTWQTPPARAAMGGLPPTVLTTISDLGDYPYQVKNNGSHSHALPINADMWQELSHPWTLALELDTHLHVNYEFKVGQQPGPASFDEAVDLTLLTMAASMQALARARDERSYRTRRLRKLASGEPM
ncbi:hypothetical protein B0H11DRAFT_1904146 [Mycena galericulata]|nr:hypothetical protein B0H11DRAFT_1942714 [Mycena galericulata]KAJ7506263.1 hypothetical protein B0H11DRAFT_1904146 [Mycena galericulata]